MLRSLLVLVTVLALSVPAGAVEKAVEQKKAVKRQAAQLLADISYFAAQAKTEADFLEAYLRSGVNPDWRHVLAQTGSLTDRARAIERLIRRLENSELTLTEQQAAELERMKAGLETMKIFIANVNRVASENQNRLIFKRDELMASANAVGVRSQIIRESARNVRERAA